MAARSSCASTIAGPMRATASSICRAARPSCSASATTARRRCGCNISAARRLNGDDSYERSYLASQGWARVASRGKSAKDGTAAVAMSGTLPAENPENLAQPWQQAARAQAPPRHGGSSAAPTGSLAALCRAPVHRVAPGARERQAARGAIVIQAGSFKNKENADKARSHACRAGARRGDADRKSAATSISACGSAHFRHSGNARRRWPSVRSAGYQGAKIVSGD